MRLPLSLAVGPYDRTRALLDGRVVPEGVDLRAIPLHPAETFLRMCNGAEFDVAEMSLGAYAIGVARGDGRFTALPVFPSRAFRHRDVYVSAAAPLEKGARVGVHRLHMTATVWQRGILADELGLAQTDVTWVQAGVHRAGTVPGRIRLRVPEGVRMETVQDRSVDQMLRDGELAAALLSHPPAGFRAGDPRIGRLFPDPQAAETAYWERTGIYPIMHAVVVRTELLERHPWLAATLAKAFTEAKRIGRQDSANAGYSPHMLPFYDLHAEREAALFGADFYPYGLGPNKHVVDAFLRHCLAQGLLDRPVSTADLFPVDPMVSGELDASPELVEDDGPFPGELPGETWRWD